ncbi:MAG: PEP-CTERM sorting domain-containing protein [Chthoniobacterales bacterium]
MKTRLATAFLSAVGLLALPGFSNATTVGTDNATAYPPLGGWNNATNGAITGDAFIPWIFSNNGIGFNGMFLGDSTTLNGGTGGNINTGNIAMGMYGNGGGFNEAARFLNDTLAAGQTLTFDLAVNWRNGNKGVDLRDVSTTPLFNFNIGSDLYSVSGAATGNGNLYSDLPDNGYNADTVFNLSFTQVDDLGGTWTITRSGGISDVDSGTYAGVIDSFKLYIGTDGGGDTNNLFLNNMAVVDIVPEPATLTLLIGAGVIALLFRYRRFSR